MTRLLWSAVATFVLVALTAPCLTFYILIKEYWAEVDSLRHELFLCQFNPKDPSVTDGLPEELPISGIQNPRFSDDNDIPQSLPIPQRQVQKEVPKRRAIITERSAPLSHYITSIAAPQFSDENRIKGKLQRRKNSSHKFRSSSSSSGRSLSSSMVMFSDDPNAHLPSSGSRNEKMVVLPKEYVKKIEKKVLDLSTRVTACRKCLNATKQKDGNCGVGPSWREFRRMDKVVRREMRKEKRRRRKIGKTKEKQQENSGKGGQLPTTTTSTFSPPPSTVPEKSDPSETPPLKETTSWKPLSDISPIYSYRLENTKPQDNHQMRQNHRISTDFRRSFNQKILRMDESLMQFTETQSAFCKELRDNLGGSLEKRGQELEALSEQIAALVRTTTAQVVMIEKLTSDQVHAGQTNIEKHLANLQVLREDQVRSFKNFHKKIFLPAMVTLTSLLGEQASSVTNMGVDLITKIEMLQDTFLTFSTQQGDMLIKLSEEVDMFTSKHGNQIMRARDHAKHFHLNTENFIRELQTRMNNVVKELVLVRLQSQSFVSINENTYHEISTSLNKTEGVVSTLSGDLQRRVDKAKSDLNDFRDEFRQETDGVTSRIESGVSEVLMRNHGGITQIGEVELDTRAFSKSGEAAWNEMYVTQETELRQEADMLANNLRSQTHHTQNILTGLRGTASTHEQVLEQQRMDFQGFVRKRQDSLDSQCSSISDWSILMSSELRRRDEDLHRFLSEELRVSPVDVHGVTEFSEYKVPELEDVSLRFDSSSSEPFPFREESSSDLTSRPTEEEGESWNTSSSVNVSAGKSSSPPQATNASLPTSSRFQFPFLLPSGTPSLNTTSKKALDTSSQGNGQGGNFSFVLGEVGGGEGDTDGGPTRGDLYNVQDNLLGVESFETLSNDIKVDSDDQFVNRITHQNDQAVSRANDTAEDGGLEEVDNSTLLSSTNQEEEDGGEFLKLEDMLNETKRTIVKLRKDFVNESIHELKLDWPQFILNKTKFMNIEPFNSENEFKQWLREAEQVTENGISAIKGSRLRLQQDQTGTPQVELESRSQKNISFS